jgi:murein DD-endopeptidase MepM/ murein hydrolase activator NlpD
MVRWFLAALAAGVAFWAPAAAQGADFSVLQARIAPRQFFLASGADARISFWIEAEAPKDVVVRVLGGKREVRRFTLRSVPPGVHRFVAWRGLTGGGRPAGDGRYRVEIGAPGERGKRAGTVTLRGHAFPVPGRHGTRGSIGSFHAPRNGGRIHEGFDIVARCGRPLVAARAGTVIRRGFDPVLYGNYVLIRGLGERYSYFYAHMVRPAQVRRGEEVETGERVGRIGQTGNAGGTPCHLHFEVRRRGHAVDPEPLLRAWDRFS